jgi:2-iminobutanoate/2-iminopropanoate deaminase
LLNLESVLGAAGFSFGDVVKTTIFLSDLATFAAVNSIYAGHVKDPAPARSTVQVAALPRGAMVEIEAIARRSS